VLSKPLLTASFILQDLCRCKAAMMDLVLLAVLQLLLLQVLCCFR